MPIHHILILAIIQGITEFLPISSSGHLVLTSRVLGWADQGLAVDVAVHVGSLFAVLVYFWRDTGHLFIGAWRTLSGRGGPHARLLGNVVVASIPLVAVGYFAKEIVEFSFRSVEVIAWATLGFGILLWIADHVGMTIRRVEHIRWAGALIIGCSQVLALIPGTSRSGITMTAARFLGLERADAARFSMLISIPAILGAGALKGWDIYQAGDTQLTYDLGLAAFFAFVTALIAIAFMMAWLKRTGFGIFVIYRLILGGGLLYWAYSTSAV